MNNRRINNRHVNNVRRVLDDLGNITNDINSEISILQSYYESMNIRDTHEVIVEHWKSVLEDSFSELYDYINRSDNIDDESVVRSLEHALFSDYLTTI